MIRILQVASMAFSLCLGSLANAHFVWLVQSGDKVEVVFSESAEASEPELLKNVAGASVWAVASGGRDGAKFTEVPLDLTEKSLTGTIAEGSSAVILSHKYGVVEKGDSKFLLSYLAKQHLSPVPRQWTAVKSDDKLPLEVTPSWQGRKLVISVTWNGKPAAGVEVNAGGCGVDQTLKTDEGGRAECEPKADGIMSIRARMIEPLSGELDGKAYDSVRTYSTLTLPLTVPVVQAVSHAIPALPKGVTSFGAAMIGNDLYVYGGHFGDAHHYSESGQSNEFRRLSINSESPAWEDLPSGPKLTGLALVEYGGKLYRIGGFTARNKDDEDQSLWSQDSFASFDPAAGVWTDLPPMPSGRSSHDAAVLDGKLYIVGGWNMAGSDSTTWHTTALVCDLNQKELKWQELPAPGFERRAVSLAACKGKLFVIGGMESTDETTRKVSVFDPATQTWSDGPELLGKGMEGFGTSSFATGDRLVVTTMSGSVQALSDDGLHWTMIGQTVEPRFFHRQLTTPDGRILLIAGASMSTGKTSTLELLQDSSLP